MICLHTDYQFLSSLTLILYTFVIFPFLEIIQTAATVLWFLIDPHRRIESSEENQGWEIDLQVSKVLDEDEDDNVCSICLMKFLKEEMINELPRCGHVFHIGCLEKWIDTCHFTCPLCRASLLHQTATSSSSAASSSPLKRINLPFCVNL
ncbi:RING-H2 finger protein ATL18-like [Andrographis paniculata]|uniref:RING-H2 finger protein ATL18-like n=1 Tax=Andrographis paniculata TaxID=175694 RepID=UPI0021E940CF|nr:RING-H2 finger protein ATL18-like [Andrographis paniculata]